METFANKLQLTFSTKISFPSTLEFNVNLNLQIKNEHIVSVNLKLSIKVCLDEQT